jgi:hypothetical protein
MSRTFATITQRMRLNLFARNDPPQPPADPTHPSTPAPTAGPATLPHSGGTFPADEVVWGIVIRHGFDEIDDPGYHRGTTQHAYLEGNDTVALCGFRPPQSGSRTRRRARLGLPTTGQHPMCGMCARMVVAPRPRVPVPVQPARPVPVPVAMGARLGRPVMVGSPSGALAAGSAGNVVSPWVRRAADAPSPASLSYPPDSRNGSYPPDSRDGGLLGRGVHADVEP